MLTNYNDMCILCYEPKEEMHHLVYGIANRKLCDADELLIPVCRKCHDFMHKHSNISRIIGQLAYERDKCAEGYGVDAARESFRIRYGKTYL